MIDLPPAYKRELMIELDDPRWMKQREHLEEKIALYSALVDEGLTVSDIAKRVGVSQPNASRFLKKHFIDNRNRLYMNTFRKGNAPA